MRDNLISKTPVDKMSPREKYELKLVAELLADRWMDKLTIGGVLNLCERHARDRVATVAQKHPVIFSSSRKGYKIATGVKDLQLVKATINEIESRIKQLRKRVRPLKKFVRENNEEYGNY